MDHVLDSFFREQPWLRALARSLVRDDAEAEDLVQETWLAALRNPPQSPENPRAWLRVVVRRLAARRRARWDVELAEPDAHIGADELPEEVVARWESTGLLRAAIDDLPASERAVVLLRFQEGRSLQEVAATLEISARSVSERLRSARSRLRIRLGDRYDEEGAGPPAWLAALAPLVDPEEWVASAQHMLGRAASSAAASSGGPMAGGTVAGGTLGALLANGASVKLLGAVLLMLLGAWIVPAWLQDRTPLDLPEPAVTARAVSAPATLRADPRRSEHARSERSTSESRVGAAPGPVPERTRRFQVSLFVDTPPGVELLDYRFRAYTSGAGPSSAGASTMLELGGEAQLEITCAWGPDQQVPDQVGSSVVVLLLEPDPDVANHVGRPTYRLELDPSLVDETHTLRVRLDPGDLDVPDPAPRVPGDWLPRAVVLRRTLTEWPQPAGALGPWTVRAKASIRRGVASFEDLPSGTFEVEHLPDEREAGAIVVSPRAVR